MMYNICVKNIIVLAHLMLGSEHFPNKQKAKYSKEKKIGDKLDKELDNELEELAEKRSD